MSNVTLFANNTIPAVPAYLQGHNSAVGQAIKTNMEGNKISIRGRTWRLIQDGTEVAVSGNPDMDFVIIAALPDISRTYYNKQYVDGTTESPNCWSSNGVQPDKAVDAPQHSNCAECPMNKPGSGGRADTRACRFSKRIAVAVPAELEQEGGTPRAYLMSIPSTSLFGDKVGDNEPKPLTQYGNFLAARNTDVTTIVTRFSFDLQQTQPTMRFSAVRFLTQQEFSSACKLMRDPETHSLLVMKYTSKTHTNSAVMPQQTAFVPAAQVATPTVAAASTGFTPIATPEPIPTQRDTTPVNEEPVVINTAQAAQAAGVPESSVADILKKWGA